MKNVFLGVLAMVLVLGMAGCPTDGGGGDDSILNGTWFRIDDDNYYQIKIDGSSWVYSQGEYSEDGELEDVDVQDIIKGTWSSGNSVITGSSSGVLKLIVNEIRSGESMQSLPEENEDAQANAAAFKLSPSGDWMTISNAILSDETIDWDTEGVWETLEGLWQKYFEPEGSPFEGEYDWADVSGSGGGSATTSEDPNGDRRITGNAGSGGGSGSGSGGGTGGKATPKGIAGGKNETLDALKKALALQFNTKNMGGGGSGGSGSGSGSGGSGKFKAQLMTSDGDIFEHAFTSGSIGKPLALKFMDFERQKGFFKTDPLDPSKITDIRFVTDDGFSGPFDLTIGDLTLYIPKVRNEVNPFNGTWTFDGPGGRFEFKFNGGNWEAFLNGLSYSKGTFDWRGGNKGKWTVTDKGLGGINIGGLGTVSIKNGVFDILKFLDLRGKGPFNFVIPEVPIEVLPGEIKDQFEEDMPIYEGSNPPDIEGQYVRNNSVLAGSNISNDNPGDTYSDLFIAFIKAPNGKLSFRSRQGTTETGSDDVTVQLVGTGNNFTAFFVAEGMSGSVKITQSTIISGTLESGGIRNFHYAFVIVNKEPNNPNDGIMAINSYRVIKDGDGLAAKQTWYTGGGGGGGTTPEISSFAGTWNNGTKSITFTGNNFTYKEGGTTKYSGTFSVSSATSITFYESSLGGSASGNYSLSGTTFTLSNHTWDSTVNGTYTKDSGGGGNAGKYIINGSGTSFTATKGGTDVTGAVNQPIATVITAIRTDANGANIEIQFGNGTEVLTVTGNYVDINGGPWGTITLSGKITSNAETATIWIRGTGLNVISTADVETTYSGSYDAAGFLVSLNNTLTITGGTVKATGTYNYAVRNLGLGTVTIGAGATIIGTTSGVN